MTQQGLSLTGYCVTRWDSATPPTEAMLARGLQREGFTQITQQQLAAGTHTGEQEFAETHSITLLCGCLELAMPGRGSITLKPGDRIDIAPKIRFEASVNPQQGEATFYFVTST